MKFLATCTPGVESLVKNELKRKGISHTYGQDRLVGFDGDLETLSTANVWLRTANRVYIEIEKIRVTSFEGLFAVIESLDWSPWIPGNTPIIVNATSIRSAISHTPTMQSVGKKAIIKSLTGARFEHWNENPIYYPIEIFLLIVADELHVLINTSGPALHKRGYRTETGEAPIKESLAAAIVLFSGWKYKTPLYDPLCGSGTLLIEAAMIARNQAPGLTRDFDFLHFPWADEAIHQSVIRKAQSEIYTGTYDIQGSDHDPHMIEIAQRNAVSAGVGDMIQWSVMSLVERQYVSRGYLVTNPPYGRRIGHDADLLSLYETLESQCETSDLTGNVITSYEKFPHNPAKWSSKNLMNGGEKCHLWRRISG